MSGPIGCVVVSDIHAGAINALQELTVAGQAASRQKPVAYDSLRDSLHSLVNTVPAARRFLVCPGDLSTRTHSEELRIACAFLNRLADDLQVPAGHRILVPGNHDTDWQLTTLGEVDPWYLPLRHRKFAEIAASQLIGFEMCSAGQVRLIRALHDDILVLLIDSAFEDAHTTQPHHGKVGSAQRDRCRSLLESAPASAVKIAVLHHHVMQVRKGEDGPDYSILSDARDLLEMFRDTGVCAVIHGHGHRPFMESIGESHLAIVGAGSVGAAGQALPDEQRNTAHVIVMDRDASGDVVGVVRSTEYSRADNRWVVESLLGVHTYDAPRVYYIGARTKARLQEAVLGILSAAREKGAVYVKEYRQHAGLGDLDATALVEEVRRYVELLTTAEYSVIERAGGEDVQVHFEGQLHDA